MSGFGCGCGCNGGGGCAPAPPVVNWGMAGIASTLGLGCDCQETDADGNCLDPDPCTTANTGSSSSAGGSSLPSYTCADGAIVLSSADCFENQPSLGGTGSTTGSTINVNVSNPSTGQSASGNIVATDLANLGAQFTKIFGNIVAPQTTITTANGTQISTPAGQTANLAGVLGGASALTSSSIGAYLPWILLAVGGFMLVSAMKK